MPYSGTFSFAVSRDDIVREAMLNIGKLGAVDPISSQDMTDVVRKLNLIIKQIMGRLNFGNGLKVWSQQHADLFLSSTKYRYSIGPNTGGDNWAAGVTAIPGASSFATTLVASAGMGSNTLYVSSTMTVWPYTTGDYIVVQLGTGDTFSTTLASGVQSTGTLTLNGTLPSTCNSGASVFNYSTVGQRLLELQTVILRDSFSNDTPINKMTLETYESLPTKTQTGYLSDPTAIYYEATLGNGTIWIDCAGAQDTSKYLHIVGLTDTQDITNPTDNLWYPKEYALYFCWALSKQIAPMYNAVWTPEMQDNLDQSQAFAFESYPETTETYFQCNADVA